MKELKVMVVANEGGSLAVEAVRERLQDLPGFERVNVTIAIEVGPAPKPEPFNEDVPDWVTARRFFLWRETDATEVTVPAGEDPRVVAIGVQFPDGQCALWWAPPGFAGSGGERPSTSVAVWPSIEDLKAIHLHPRSRTKLIWVE